MPASDHSFSSELNTSLKIPADLLEKVSQSNISADALLALLGLLQLLAYSAEDASLVLEFTLKELMLMRAFEGDAPRFADALAQLAQAGLILRYMDPAKENVAYLCPSTPQNRELLAALEKDNRHLSSVRVADQLPLEEAPNIYKLYEDNIGPLTPMMVEILREDEQNYPPEWIAEAIAEALKNNARNWKYVSAILSNWKEKGHGKRKEEAPENLERYRELYRQQKRKSGG